MTLTLPLLGAPPPVRAALTLALGIAVAVCGLLLLIAATVLVVIAIRRATRGHDLDRILLRLHLARSRTWPTSRLGRLERRVVWGTLAGAILDPSRQFVWLPDTLEVFLAPGDFRALERAALRLQRRVLKRLHAVTTVGPCRFQAQPIVVFAEDMAGRPGRPTLRVSFAEATEQAGQPVGARREQTPTSNVSVLRHAYMQPLRPPGPPRRLQVGRPFFIGRLPSCDLVLDQPAISRRHAVIYQRDGVWYIADAGSSNGTYVNLTPTAEPVRLLDGDEIRLGGSVSLRFELRSQRHRLR